MFSFSCFYVVGHLNKRTPPAHVAQSPLPSLRKAEVAFGELGSSR